MWCFHLVTQKGFEPLAFWFVVKRSIQLSYGCDSQFSVPFARNKKYYTARREECQYFFENYFSFSPFGWKRGNLGQKPGDFWGKTGRRKWERKIMFFPCKEKKKASKTENGVSSGGMRRRTETSDVTSRTSVDNNNYPQFSPENGDLPVDNCG